MQFCLKPTFIVCPAVWRFRRWPLGYQGQINPNKNGRQQHIGRQVSVNKCTHNQRKANCYKTGCNKRHVVYEAPQKPNARASTGSWLTDSLVEKPLDENILWRISCGWNIPWMIFFFWGGGERGHSMSDTQYRRVLPLADIANCTVVAGFCSMFAQLDPWHVIV